MLYFWHGGVFYDTKNDSFLSQARKIAGCSLLPSQHKSHEQLRSLEIQKSYFETMIQENPNWQFVKIYSDVGSALRTKNRTGLSSDDPRWKEGSVRFRPSKIIKSVRT